MAVAFDAYLPALALSGILELVTFPDTVFGKG
jgi:hypothetical protein